MGKFFTFIYDWFDKHNRIFYTVLVSCIVLFSLMASKISLQENITNFFGRGNEKDTSVFENVRIKDKIVVILSGSDPDKLIDASYVFEQNIKSLFDENLIRSVMSNVDEDVIFKCSSFIYGYLPVFLEDKDFLLLESKINKDSIEASMDRAYSLLSSPSSMVVKDFILKDPLGIGTGMLQKFEKFNPDLDYEIYNGHIFTKDMSSLLMFIEPAYGMGDTGKNERLVYLLEQAKNKTEKENISVDCIGGHIMSVYNARQIKKDTTLTMTIALAIILLLLFFSFSNRWSIPMIIIPPLFGVLFSLSMIWLIQGDISAIALGAGSIVFGISLSYSIHIISHLNNKVSSRDIIEELSAPLTIGSFTTIGAFLALKFTSSPLLQDMGLFSVFTLLGTTLFCLIFLPHLLNRFKVSRQTVLLRKIERIVSYRYENNKWIILFVSLSTIVALFYFTDVNFNQDISKLNYVPETLKQANENLENIIKDDKDVFIASVSSNVDSLIVEYNKLSALIDRHMDSGGIANATGVSSFLVPLDIQSKRIQRWNDFWSRHKDQTMSYINELAKKRGFADGAFLGFEDVISKNYKPCRYTNEEIGEIPVIAQWINEDNGVHTALTKIAITPEYKSSFYSALDSLSNTSAIDRAYFSSKMVESTNNDFNYILFVSSFIVFIALWLSYGRIELTLLTFLPMIVSWIMILGLMTWLNIEFNIVNIILATFIFGIGDDFSIFIMDGLIQEHKNGKNVINAHKVAIFFSAFTAIVGMGALMFAKHPALKSISFISVFGLVIVVLVSYTVQPILFRLFIGNNIKQKKQPYTLFSLLHTVYCFSYFLLGCIILNIFVVLLWIIPANKKKKQLWLHKAIYYFSGFFLKTVFTVKVIRINEYKETYKRQSIIIANHQSLIDVLLLLSISPKIIIITNSWVWHSPFWRAIIRYAGFQCVDAGYETIASNLKQYTDEGYSVAVFPEGTRSEDCNIKRFHNGAFYLSKVLQLDILPVIIYGSGFIAGRNQGFHIKKGNVLLKTMQRFSADDNLMGVSYREKAKKYRALFIDNLKTISQEYDRYNSYFRDVLLKNYIYKGPVLEWYMRIKCKIDNYYYMWHKMIPTDATVTDMGCGYGQMSFMLSLLSPCRRVVGIDYDSDKIDMARNSFLFKGNMDFICGDMRTVDIPASDVILFNDSLHYIDRQSQIDVINKAIRSLNYNGFIVVRDGDPFSEGHSKIENTELWSTKILGFNKTSQKLEFLDSSTIKSMAEENGLDIIVRKCDRNSSETLYILKKTGNGKI